VLYETFLANCWAFKDRLVPMRMETVDGLKEVFNHGLKADLVYVDASHYYVDVRAEIETSLTLFPGVQIVGDDFNWAGDQVRRAVEEMAVKFNKQVVSSHSGWYYNDRKSL
jgi:hypothetical protein